MSQSKPTALPVKEQDTSALGAKMYEGVRQGKDVTVTVNGRPLDPRLDLWNHSPTGLEWGYAGSGPAQLALALLADHLGDDDPAISLHQEFKFKVVTRTKFTARR